MKFAAHMKDLRNDDLFSMAVSTNTVEIPFWEWERLKKKEQIFPKKVIFNQPATIVFWSDGSKTVVKCSDQDEWSPYTGFAMAYLKKSLGSGKKAKRFVEENNFVPDFDIF